MGVMSYQFQVLCPGTSCGNGNACGATFSLTQKNADGLPKVTFSECGVLNEISDMSEATTTTTSTTTNINQGREGPTTVATELGNSAGGETIHEISSEDVNHLSTAAVSGAIALLILLIAITAYWICRRRKRNISSIGVSITNYPTHGKKAYK